ncbi:hypothetical protein GBAR_LOCUS6311 [Geodia barretti]|uniref:Uncharacterized protein n=1 Tax=Geodia barretti TaxID=519541 RepID=A0AA35W6Q4_GEOBA|nr:hypothetical protein GBAR_LOCUS6311 [Geodia barretti]
MNLCCWFYGSDNWRVLSPAVEESICRLCVCAVLSIAFLIPMENSFHYVCQCTTSMAKGYVLCTGEMLEGGDNRGVQTGESC